jgi:DNA-binding NarL/FixJ family response regulator
MGYRGKVPTGIEAIAGQAPRGLSVHTLGDEFAVFQWETEVVTAERACAALTRAERSVLELLAAGASNAQIAGARGSSVRTVANQVASLLKKLAAGSRFELVRRYGRSHADPRAT